MYEEVAKRILFDFELIALITLVIGLGVYGLSGSWKKAAGEGIGSQFQPLDLALVCFPLVFFLVTPIFGYLYPETEAAAAEVPTGELSALGQMTAGLAQLVYFFFIGMITFVILQWIMMRDTVELLGLKRMKWRMILLVAVSGTFLSFVTCNLVVGNASSVFLSERLGELSMQKAVEDMKSATSVPVIVLSVILACVAAPLVEELLFRGYFYGVIKRFTSPLFAATVTSALFAVVHVNLPALVPLWLFALILTLSYEATRCLWVPICIHSMFNGINIILLFWEVGTPGDQ